MGVSSISTVQNTPDMPIARRREAEVQLQIPEKPPISLENKKEEKPSSKGLFSTYA